MTPIIAPSGEVVAQSKTLADELVIHECDLDESLAYCDLFNFADNRHIEHYGKIATQAGATQPERSSNRT